MMKIPDIFPRFPKPKELLVFKSNELCWERRMALSSLQGMVNSRQPRIYHVTAPWDEHWLRYYRDRFGVRFDFLEDPMDLFKTFTDIPRGLVIYDADVPDTANVAVTLAGLDGLIPANGEFASELESYGLECKEDLRGRFNDRLSTYRWTKDELLSRCNKHILGSLCVGKRRYWIQNRTTLIDYLVANKAFVFHLSSARRDREESSLFDEILEEAGGPGALMGWHCVRDKEKEYVSKAARKGFFVLCSANAPNLTVHGGIPPVREKYVQKPPKPLDKIEKKVYVTMYLTDGDAIWAMDNLQSQNWDSKSRGKIPFNWGLLPLLYDIAPGMLEYYYETATEKDYFACPSSGAAYTYSYLQDDWYLHYSKHYMDLSGQIVGNMVNWDTNFWWREVEEPGAIYREKRILKPIGMVCGLGGSVFARSYPTGIPKVHASLVLFEWENCAKKILDAASAMKERPLFLFAFVSIGHGVLDHLAENLKSLPDDIEIINMDTFMMSLRKAAKEGLVGEDLYPSKMNLAESTLVVPGQKNKASAIKLLQKLAQVAEMPDEEMLEEINLGNWINLASHEPSSVEADIKSWRRNNEGYLPYDTPNLADGLGYNLFYTTWGYVRACLNAAGRYTNHMDSCLDEYLEIFQDPDNYILEEIWEMWHRWETDPPSLERVKELTIKANRLVSKKAQSEG